MSLMLLAGGTLRQCYAVWHRYPGPVAPGRKSTPMRVAQQVASGACRRVGATRTRLQRVAPPTAVRHPPVPVQRVAHVLRQHVDIGGGGAAVRGGQRGGQLGGGGGGKGGGKAGEAGE